jgi:amidohydrolase
MDFSLIRSEASGLREKLIHWRRDIHQHPETELACHYTAQKVIEIVEPLHYRLQTGLACSGIVATLGVGSPVVALRVDMDALPVKEETGVPFASRVEGVMHACGHDGHTAIGLGVAHVLACLLREARGSVKLIFQPGEEYPGGATLMIKEGALAGDFPDCIFGMHLYPELPSGKIGLRYGTLTASNDEFTIKLQGKSGHCAHPHQGIDPFPAVATFINAIQTVVSRNADPLDPMVVGLAAIRGGAGHNTISEEISLKGTIRCLTSGNRKLARQKLQDIITGLEKTFQIRGSLQVVRREPVMSCDETVTRMAEETLKQFLGKEEIVEIKQPSLGADDFAYFAQQIPATYLRLGCYDACKGYVHMLHSNRFNFDEELLVKGVEALSVVMYRAPLETPAA